MPFVRGRNSLGFGLNNVITVRKETFSVFFRFAGQIDQAQHSEHCRLQLPQRRRTIENVEGEGLGAGFAVGVEVVGVEVVLHS